MRIANGNQFDDFAIHVERDLLVVGHNGKSSRRRRSARSAIGSGLGFARRYRNCSREKIVTPILPRFSFPPV
jgi:hypothetical protein